ncbi:MAG: prepilin-type N-terminal cleavage/methylation domain-containing protein [Opitutaceae bacterium]|nr:prepilin-type N-terminal cleavage/methylation domain-containing protein [Opitutaceae bacterium]
MNQARLNGTTTRPRPRPRVSSRRVSVRAHAFTLTELLTVIAIIGILAAILLPVTTKIRSTARAAVCISNLRQIYLATRQYAVDNKDATPPYNWHHPASEPTASLAPYLAAPRNWSDQQKSVLTCPEMDARFPTQYIGRNTYTANPYVSSTTDANTPRPPAGPGDIAYVTRFSECQNPKRMAFFFDGVPNNINAASGKWSYITRAWPGNMKANQGFVHAGSTANTVFVDGHLEKVSCAQFTTDTQPDKNLLWHGY